MRIYLMRHAEAVEPGEWNGPDRTRPLTAIGRAKLAGAIEHMRRLRLSADLLLSSPYVRAVQTAEAVAEQLHVLQCVPCEELGAGTRLPAFQSLIRSHASEPSIWIVAHMPELAVFASRITGDPKALERPFHPAEVLAADIAMSDGAIGDGRIAWRRRVEDWPTVSA